MTQLSPREKQIIPLIEAGDENKEIAWKLQIAEGTVKEYIHNIAKKLHMNRVQIAVASAKGLLALMLVSVALGQTTRPVVLTWAASPTIGVTGYNVYRAPSLKGPFTLLTVAPVVDPTYTDSAPVDAIYTYRVTAVGPPCTPTSPVPGACGESAPIEFTTAVPERPATVKTVTAVVP